MKLKNSFFFTLRENVKDEDSQSGNLLVRAGFAKKNSAGVYMMLPLGFKVKTKIENIIRAEMNAIDSQEVSMPSLIPEDVYIQSGRRANFGASMFSLKDRFDKNYVLGPTHEELFAAAASMKIRSYKDMPFSLYQFQTKFRDEPRPRYGLIRVREFTMKDSYSFDTDEVALDVAYKKMFNAYIKSFDKMGLDYKIVTADTGVMGGLLSEEFQAVTDIGEDILVLCDKCDYASNLEVANCVNSEICNTLELKEKQLVHTPMAKTIDEVCAFLNQDKNRFIKTIIYLVDGVAVACMVMGNREINETKLRKLYGANEVILADNETVERVTSAKVGFAGPIGIKCELVMDEEILNHNYFITGANQNDYHYVDVCKQDFKADKIADIRNIQEHDICPVCGGNIYFKHGIEIGNTFKLGTKYSKAMNLEYADSNNKLNDVWMGSYGIGSGRCMAAIVEQNNDDNGINWPISVAPYTVCIVLISLKDEAQVNLANSLYNELKALNIDVVLDDRDERVGVKFKDMELIGVPYRITVGKKAVDSIVEFKARLDEKAIDINSDEIINHVINLLK